MSYITYIHQFVHTYVHACIQQLLPAYLPPCLPTYLPMHACTASFVHVRVLVHPLAGVDHCLNSQNQGLTLVHITRAHQKRWFRAWGQAEP